VTAACRCIRRRPDGSWEARYRDAAGTRRSLYGKTAEAVRRKLTRATHERDRGLPTADNRLTVEHYLLKWLETMRPPRVREAT
jgi:hypothetical protein